MVAQQQLTYFYFIRYFKNTNILIIIPCYETKVCIWLKMVNIIYNIIYIVIFVIKRVNLLLIYALNYEILVCSNDYSIYRLSLKLSVLNFILFSFCRHDYTFWRHRNKNNSLFDIIGKVWCNFLSDSIGKSKCVFDLHCVWNFVSRRSESATLITKT